MKCIECGKIVKRYRSGTWHCISCSFVFRYWDDGYSVYWKQGMNKAIVTNNCLVVRKEYELPKL